MQATVHLDRREESIERQAHFIHFSMALYIYVMNRMKITWLRKLLCFATEAKDAKNQQSPSSPCIISSIVDPLIRNFGWDEISCGKLVMHKRAGYDEFVRLLQLAYRADWVCCIDEAYDNGLIVVIQNSPIIISKFQNHWYTGRLPVSLHTPYHDKMTVGIDKSLSLYLSISLPLRCGAILSQSIFLQIVPHVTCSTVTSSLQGGHAALMVVMS